MGTGSSHIGVTFYLQTAIVQVKAFFMALTISISKSTAPMYIWEILWVKELEFNLCDLVER